MGVPTAAVKTLGCKVNQAEGDTLSAALAGLGFSAVDFGEVADVYVVNSCTVTAEADHKSRRLARAALRANPDALVFMAGCYATEADHRAARLPDSVVLVPAAAKDTLADEIASRFGLAPPGVGGTVGRTGIRTRAMVKVQDGCDNSCAYCVVPLARGGSRSRLAADVLAEAGDLVHSGTAEIVLAGINLGRYESDGLGLVELTRGILSTGLERLRLSSIEPQDFSDDLVELIADEERLCPHVHIPLQSGSDDVLRRMNRRYLSSDFESLSRKLLAARPGVALTTDAIAGFPGESDADFDATLRLLERVAPMKTHVFKYSVRPRTRAASMRDQIDPETKRDRAAAAAHLDSRLGAEFAEALGGASLDVLVERIDGERASGLSGNYVRCFFKGEGVQKGTIVGITATRAVGRAVEGKRIAGS